MLLHRLRIVLFFGALFLASSGTTNDAHAGARSMGVFVVDIGRQETSVALKRTSTTRSTTARWLFAPIGMPAAKPSLPLVDSRPTLWR